MEPILIGVVLVILMIAGPAILEAIAAFISALASNPIPLIIIVGLLILLLAGCDMPTNADSMSFGEYVIMFMVITILYGVYRAAKFIRKNSRARFVSDGTSVYLNR